MGTRGLYVFKYKGFHYIFYNHWDSYPEWLGKKIVEELKYLKLDRVRELLTRIKRTDINKGTKNFEGLLNALLNVDKFSLVDITPTRVDFKEYDACYLYVIDFDNDTLEITSIVNETNVFFNIEEIPDNWYDIVKREMAL
jgi:hypothetical protein